MCDFLQFYADRQKYFERKIVNISYPSVLSYVLGAQNLTESVLLSTHSIP